MTVLSNVREQANPFLPILPKVLPKEFKRFLKIALGSSDEIITHLRAIAITVPRLTPEAKKLALEYKICLGELIIKHIPSGVLANSDSLVL